MNFPYNNFKYSHTIQAQQMINLEQESQDLKQLFKMGRDYISKQQKQQQQSESASIQFLQKQIKKEKKIKKQKKQKKQKKKKEKKQKKKKQKKQRPQSDQKNIAIQTSNLATTSNLNYQSIQQFFNKKIDLELTQKIHSNFVYNQKISDDLLSFSVIKFAQKSIAQYGINSKNIPQYKRLNYNMIVGLKSSKYTKQVIQQLNKIINQKNDVFQQKNQNRYFQYSFDKSVGEKIKRIQTRKDIDNLIINFDNSYWADFKTSKLENLKTMTIDHKQMDQSQSQLLRLNKQYNNQIIKLPHDVKLWIKFISIQDQIANLSGFNKNKSSLTERKLSIVQKALEKNPSQIQFKILYLNYTYQLKKGDFYTKICEKCFQYIDQHPQSIDLWQLYLSFRFSQFSSFSNSFLRKQFQDITKKLRKKIQQATSASLIWKIRKASLFVLSKIFLILKLQGYNELSTGICQGLLEYNIFIPQKINSSNNYTFRAQAFKSYWEDYKAYRVGQIQEYTSWDTYYKSIQQLNPETYIGLYQEKKIKTQQDINLEWVDLEINAKKNLANWRPCHINHDSNRIEECPESFILFEDIEHLLQIYRDNDNLQILVDIVFQNLGFPAVFNKSVDLKSQSNCKYIYNKLREKIINKKFLNFSQGEKLDLWLKFWDPRQIYLFINNNNWRVKLIYIKRLLNFLKLKMINIIQIDIYILYLQIIIYLHPEIMQGVYDCVQIRSKKNISEILQKNNKNIDIWICYIEGQHLKRRNTDQCFNVYKQLIFFQKLSRKKIYKVLYYFFLSIKKWQGDLAKVIAFIFGFVKDHNINDVIQKQMRPFDILLLFKLLLQRYKQFQQKPVKKQQKQFTKRHIISYFILEISNIYQPPSQTASAIKKIKERLAVQAFKDQISCLILLRTKQKYTFKKLDVIPKKLCEIEYLIFNYQFPTFMIKYHFNRLFNVNLATWMIIFCFFLRSDNQKLIELFFLYGKQLVSSNYLSSRQISYTIRFARLVAQNQADIRFLFTCIDHIPYAKELFLLYLKLSGSEQQKIKIKKIMWQKQLRIVYKQMVN